MFLLLWQIWRGQLNVLEIRKALGNDLLRSNQLIKTLRLEQRYLTDLVVGFMDKIPPADFSPLSFFGRKRYEAHQRVVSFARAVNDSRIRELYLEQIFPGIGQVKVPLGAVNEVTLHPNKVDMLYVCAVAHHKGARRAFEFGTYMGRTTYHLAKTSPEMEVTTLSISPDKDPLFGPFLGKFFKGRPEAARIKLLLQDSRDFDPAPYKGMFDVVFVDGDHSYELVKNDTLKAFQLLKKGGVILWHDYAPKSPGLVQFFKEFTQERPLFRIKHTCLLLHIDGMDPLAFEPAPMEATLEGKFYEETPDYVQELYHL